MSTPTEVTKIGNLTKEPVAGEGKGTNYCRFPIAVEVPVTPGDWKGEMNTTYYECVAFGSVADHVLESVTKGDRVVVVGKPEIDTWTGRDNQERTTKRIVCNVVAADLRFVSVQLNRTAKRSVPQAQAHPQAVSELDEF